MHTVRPLPHYVSPHIALSGFSSPSVGLSTTIHVPKKVSHMKIHTLCLFPPLPYTFASVHIIEPTILSFDQLVFERPAMESNACLDLILECQYQQKIRREEIEEFAIPRNKLPFSRFLFPYKSPINHFPSAIIFAAGVYGSSPAHRDESISGKISIVLKIAPCEPLNGLG